jgi:DnaJ-class molecular chaperone
MTEQPEHKVAQTQPTLNPGDQAAPGTPGTGEDTCPVCHGTGTLGATPCQNCGGTGIIIQGVGGA